MFEDAIRYPWTGDDKVETLAIGGILGLLGFLLIPLFLVYGYLVRVLRRVMAGDDEAPPGFEDWEELLVDGLKAFVVSLVYGLVPAVVVTIAAASLVVPATFVEGGSPDPGPNVLGLIAALAVVAAALAVGLAAAYLLPAGVAAFARTGRVGAAFSPSELRRIGGSRSYAVAWLVAVAIAVLANLAAGALAVTVVGLALLPFVSFYANVAGAYAVARGVRDVSPLETGPGTAATDRYHA